MDTTSDEGCIAVADRSGLVEEYHTGALALADASGALVAGFGDIHRPFFIRSSAKPFQALAALEAGVDLPDTHLAVACASHSASPVHVSIVIDILARYGLDGGDLRCPPARPIGRADLALAANGKVQPDRRYHNCSGKHAAMLAACVVAGWDTASYLAVDHPLQLKIKSVIEEMVGEPVGPPGVDGCGVPVWRTTTLGLARAFSRLEHDERMRRIRMVMARYPVLVSGEGREDAEIGKWLGAAAKGGASGCMGVGVAGHGVASKAWSGSSQVAAVAVGVGLDRLGVLTSAVAKGLGDVLAAPVWGGGEVVGRIRPSAVLEAL